MRKRKLVPAASVRATGGDRRPAAQQCSPQCRRFTFCRRWAASLLTKLTLSDAVLLAVEEPVDVPVAVSVGGSVGSMDSDMEALGVDEAVSVPLAVMLELQRMGGREDEGSRKTRVSRTTRVSSGARSDAQRQQVRPR